MRYQWAHSGSSTPRSSWRSGAAALAASTTLAALTSTDDFAAGVSQYGIGDLEAMATDTHKFEATLSRQPGRAVPQERAIYIERSPIHHPDQLAPILLLQETEEQGGAADAG